MASMPNVIAAVAQQQQRFRPQQQPLSKGIAPVYDMGGPSGYPQYPREAGYLVPNPAAAVGAKVPGLRAVPSGGLQPVIPLDPASVAWVSSMQQAKNSTVEKQIRFQEKNRIAAMKSRQRKKQEWERLQASEKALAEENRCMKERIAVLEGEIRVLRENQHRS